VLHRDDGVFSCQTRHIPIADFATEEIPAPFSKITMQMPLPEMTKLVGTASWTNQDELVYVLGETTIGDTLCVSVTVHNGKVTKVRNHLEPTQDYLDVIPDNGTE
jgi:hypothetical protein